MKDWEIITDFDFEYPLFWRFQSTGKNLSSFKNTSVLNYLVH